MAPELNEDVRNNIVAHCNEWNIDIEEFFENHIYPIFSKYQFMIDNPQNRKLLNDAIIDYMDNEFLPVKRDKKLKDLLCGCKECEKLGI